MSDQIKVAVSIAEMARMVGLSRQRFHQLIGTAFPFPVYAIATRRPFYPEDLQQVCVEVRRRNCGVDGKAILFYPKAQRVAPPPRIKSAPKQTKKEEHPELLAAVRSLGLASATAEQISAAVKSLFPDGVGNMDQGKVIRAVFLRLKRQDRSDNVR